MNRKKYEDLWLKNEISTYTNKLIQGIGGWCCACNTTTKSDYI